MIGIINEKDVPIPARDGLKLAANVSRPDKPGKFPVIIAFTAFSKDGLWTPVPSGGVLPMSRIAQPLLEPLFSKLKIRLSGCVTNM